MVFLIFPRFPVKTPQIYSRVIVLEGNHGKPYVPALTNDVDVMIWVSHRLLSMHWLLLGGPLTLPYGSFSSVGVHEGPPPRRSQEGPGGARKSPERARKSPERARKSPLIPEPMRNCHMDHREGCPTRKSWSILFRDGLVQLPCLHKKTDEDLLCHPPVHRN
jgi:hypothetical protein